VKIVFTMRDRKEFNEKAWGYVRHINAPRHVRLMMRDKLAQDFMDKYEAQVLKEREEAQNAADAR